MVSTSVRALTYAQAVNEAFHQEFERDPSVILMGEDIAGGAGRAGSAVGGLLRQEQHRLLREHVRVSRKLFAAEQPGQRRDCVRVHAVPGDQADIRGIGDGHDADG